MTLYTMTIAAPGEMKSPSLSLMAKPLYDEQKRRRDDDRRRVAIDQQERTIAEGVLSAAQARAIKNPDQQTRRDALAAAEAVTLLGDPVVMTQLVADDTTPEALVDIIAEQGERMAVLSTEGSFIGNAAGRYSKSANPEIALKGWSQEPHPLNRKGRTVLLERPNLTIGLATQPGLLTGMGEAGDVFQERGLMARFVFSLPESKVGDRVYDTPGLPEKVVAEYSNAIKQMMLGVWDNDTVVEMSLDPDAQTSFREFWLALEPRHKAHGDLAAVEGWAKKLPGQVLRIAAILALVNDPRAKQVSGAVMDDVIALVPYMIAHAKRVSDLMSNEKQSKLGPARAVLDWLRRTRPLGEFKAADVEKGVRGQKWCTSMEDVDAALAVLERSGWVRLIDPPPRPAGARGRPPRPKLLAHPSALASPPS